MKLLGSTEEKITKEKNGENMHRLETTEVVIVHANITNTCITHGYCLYYFQTTHSVSS